MVQEHYKNTNSKKMTKFTPMWNALTLGQQRTSRVSSIVHLDIAASTVSSSVLQDWKTQIMPPKKY